jgi:hypothetical protein
MPTLPRGVAGSLQPSPITTWPPLVTSVVTRAKLPERTGVASMIL